MGNGSIRMKKPIQATLPPRKYLAAHCTLHIARCTLHIAHCTITLHTLNKSQCTLATAKLPPHLHLYCVYCIFKQCYHLGNVSLHNAQCTMHWNIGLQCTLYIVHCTMYSVHGTGLKFTLCLHCIDVALCTVLV